MGDELMKWLPFISKAINTKKVNKNDLVVTLKSLKIYLIGVAITGLSLGLLSLSGLSSAQGDPTLSGTLTDQNGNPIPGVSLTINDSSTGDYGSADTDSNGN